MHARVVDIRSAVQVDASHTHAWHILHEASQVEPDEAARMAWYRGDPIAELGQQTAEALVACGRHEDVLAFLRSVKRDLGVELTRGFIPF
ncbi:hypothetical protein [Luteibacter yeojuensis]|uniref:Uncharacterized protein n=1 Tax=Luteibacter yeojuensis TaxID=345309 RepID=A0A7X5TRW6_9GAMM|nr:hypothetical protein [Luteibacter yeojuensis]NID17208.1 hypothetical protein [Luteibacter yeojuensis]